MSGTGNIDHDPIDHGFQNLCMETLDRFGDGDVYREAVRYRLRQTVWPSISHFAASLEASGLSDESILKTLAQTYDAKGALRTYYDKYSAHRLIHFDIFRFDGVLRIHRELVALRNHVGQMLTAMGDGGAVEDIDLRSLMDAYRIAQKVGCFPKGFGLAKLAMESKTAIEVARGRMDREDLAQAEGILIGMMKMPRRLGEVNAPANVAFIPTLLRDGLALYSRIDSGGNGRVNGIEGRTADGDIYRKWATSYIRRRLIPELVRSSIIMRQLPVDLLKEALIAEWTHYNEYLMGQYDESFRETFPEVLIEKYRYAEGDENLSPVYDHTWEAYEMIYGLISAASAFSSGSSELVGLFVERFDFLKRVIIDYSERIRRGDAIHSRANLRAEGLADTPELEEMFVIANALRALDPKRSGKKAYKFLVDQILSPQNLHSDRCYMLWRIEDFFATETGNGMKKYNEFVEGAKGADHAKPMEPALRLDLSECQTFSEYVAKRSVDSGIDLQLRLIQDVHVDSGVRLLAISRLQRWGASAEEALPVLERFGDALPKGFDAGQQILHGGRSMFGEIPLMQAIESAQTVHFMISTAVEAGNMIL